MNVTRTLRRSAVNLVRAWDTGKVTDRHEWCKTVWHLAHRSCHSKATGSFGLHPFPEELAEARRNVSR